MSAAALSSAATPLAAPARTAAAIARPQSGSEAFATVLGRSIPDDPAETAARPTPAPSDEAGAEPEAVEIGRSDGEGDPVSAAEAVEAASPPSAPLPPVPTPAAPILAGTPSDLDGVTRSPASETLVAPPADASGTNAPEVGPAPLVAAPASLVENIEATAQTTPGSQAPPSPVAEDQGLSTKAGTQVAPGVADKAAGAKPVEATEQSAVAPIASDRARSVAAVRSAVVTPIRPGKSIADPTSTPASTDNQSALSEETSAEISGDGAAPPPADLGRVRDVIDRAVARATQGPAQTPSLTDAATAPQSDASAVAPDKVATPASPTPRPEMAAPADVLATPVPAAVADDVVVSAPVSAAQTEARAEAAADLGLSTTSRASIETTAQIAAQIVRKLEGRSTRFEMALTPEDLGRVDVSLDIDADGSIAARLAFDNPVAATELRGRVDELRRQLQEAGFTVADDALSFAERDPSSAGQGGAFDRSLDRRAGRAFGAASRMAADADRAVTPHWIPLTLTPERVDMKV